MKNKHLTLKELPISERPDEKALHQGVDSLSDGELLALIIRSGTYERRSTDVASDILDAHPIYKGLIGIHYLDYRSLCRIDGVGKVKALQILCISELTKRISRCNHNKRDSFHSPRIIASFFMEEMRTRDREQMIIILLDAKSRLLEYSPISTGTVNASLVQPREIFMYALKHNAVNIIMLHNHPSGDPSPSKQDLLVTKRVKEAGALVGIPLLDHIIIGDNQYISLNERGYV